MRALLLFLSLSLSLSLSSQTPSRFVQRKGAAFVLNGEPYTYVGANYWYGSGLPLLKNASSGIDRLRKELDFLKSMGVTNLRVLAGAEGTGMVNGVERIQPVLQTSQGVFNAKTLDGLDALLAEMDKRGMKAVIFLSNNWEWSGGFLQYLRWNNRISDSVFRRKLSWDELRDNVSKFYSCTPCKDAYKKQAEYIISRTNKVTGRKYINEPAIMAWELANEPRPMRPAAATAYKAWISDITNYIRSLDSNHLITIGHEGEIGTESLSLFEEVHSNPNVDYLTIHIWPKNWEWFKPESFEKDFDQVMTKTTNYINTHVASASRLNKPLVLEEFGLPRNAISFSPTSPTTLRDRYYRAMLSIWQQHKLSDGPIRGLNFWAFGGFAKPIEGQVFWKKGDAYMGDPPMEEQGLNTVFSSDSSTWKIIRSYSLQNISAAKQKLNPDIEVRVSALLSKMNLEEKVGQMAQISIESVGDSKGEVFTLNEKMKDAVINYKLGSILNSPGPLQSIEQWNKIVGEIQSAAASTRLKIPVLYGLDHIHGVNYASNTTLFPQQIGQAATWNRKLVYDCAVVTAYESRAAGVPWTFSPSLDLGTNPLWPRLWEGYGEDPYLGSELGAQFVRGIQEPLGSKEKLAVSLKHYLAYSDPKSGKDRTDAWIPEHYLREYHLPAFAAAVKAGARTVMINSALINGIPTHVNKHLLTDILKEELGFTGFIVTDWQDIENVYRRDKMTNSIKDAIALAINAGNDMSMLPYDYKQFCTDLIALVNEGRVSMERIDDAVRRILRVKFELGLFETPLTTKDAYPKFGSEEFRVKAFNTAAESITLLKNSGNVLPLRTGAKVLLTGPNAASMRSLNGGWTYTWQGDKTDVYGERYNTIYEALRNKLGANLNFIEGVRYKQAGRYFEDTVINIEAAVQAAKGADYILLCIGENSYTETPGNLFDLNLSDNQILLATELMKTGKPVILILNEGRPRIISKIEPGAAAILHTYLPGNYGGDALADILMGDINPSGKLPLTYPRFANDLAGYIRKPSEGSTNPQGGETVPQFPFGFGLSYTSFSYDNLKTDKSEYVPTDTIVVSIDVTNKGSRKGKEVVQVYTSDLVASLTPDVLRLRGFEKIELEPGKVQTVTFRIPLTQLAFIGTNLLRHLESGSFEIRVGDKVTKISLSQSMIF